VLLAQPVGRDVVDVLLKRFDELPALPFRNKLGIAQALADVGDSRVGDRFRRALFEDYRGQYLTHDDGLALCSLVSLRGHVARRHPEALALLRQGLNEEFWETQIPWWWEQGDIPMPLQEILVVSAISGLARSGRDEAWEWVLEKKRENNPRYLERYAKFMVEAAAERRYLLDHGPAFPPTEQFIDYFFRWARTPEGREWRRWRAQILGDPLPP
jgi:hypothetical protein